MKLIIKQFFFYLMLLGYLNSNAQNTECPVFTFANDLTASTAEFKTLIKEPSNFKAWHILNKEFPSLRTNIEEIKLVANNLDKINNAGGYLKWKAVSGARNLNFSPLIKTNLNKLGATDDITKYLLAPNSKGGAYILEGVTVEDKEIAQADEVFILTGQKCIFPKNNLQAVEGFLENGTSFTMKQLESNFGNFVTRINEMYTYIKRDPNFQWNESEGYLKIPFDSFTKSDGTVQQATRSYVEQQFNAGIGRGGFLIKNDGTVKNITVFLQDGSNFKLDLSKLKP